MFTISRISKDVSQGNIELGVVNEQLLMGSIVDLVNAIGETGGNTYLPFLDGLVRQMTKNNEGSHAEAICLITKVSPQDGTRLAINWERF